MSDVISKATSDANSAMQPPRYHLALVDLHWLSAILILEALMTVAFWLKETPMVRPALDRKLVPIEGLTMRRANYEES